MSNGFGTMLFVVFVLPGLFGFLISSLAVVHNPTPDNIQKNVQWAAGESIPWYIKPVQWLASLGEVGAFLAVLLIIYAVKYPM